MSRSRLHIFWLGLAAAALFALLSASLGAGEARAGNCATMNFTFTLGSANPNTCNTQTSLNSTGAATGLRVSDGTPGAFAIVGEAAAATGSGIGVVGDAPSNSAGARGVEGDLTSPTPGLFS